MCLHNLQLLSLLSAFEHVYSQLAQKVLQRWLNEGNPSAPFKCMPRKIWCPLMFSQTDSPASCWLTACARLPACHEALKHISPPTQAWPFLLFPYSGYKPRVYACVRAQWHPLLMLSQSWRMCTFLSGNAQSGGDGDQPGCQPGASSHLHLKRGRFWVGTGQSPAWASQKWISGITHTFTLHIQLFTYYQLPKMTEKSFSS